MAILQKWSVSVEVDGKAVEEIEPRAGNGDQSTCTAGSATKYIEVKALTEFAIRIAAPKAFPLTGNAVVADIFIDGVCFAHKIFDKYNTQKGSYFLVAREKVIEGQEIGPSDENAKLKPFQFSSLQGEFFAVADTRRTFHSVGDRRYQRIEGTDCFETRQNFIGFLIFHDGSHMLIDFLTSSAQP